METEEAGVGATGAGIEASARVRIGDGVRGDDALQLRAADVRGQSGQADAVHRQLPATVDRPARSTRFH